MNALPAAVSPRQRAAQLPDTDLPADLKPNSRMRMNGLELLSLLPGDSMSVAFFDPQYRGVLDKLQYGNEGVQRGRRRSALQQMTEADIAAFVRGIDRALIPSGHLFLWMDKFHLCQGFRSWFDGTLLNVVDLINWEKGRFGMGYRSRRVTEHCVVLQKHPRRARGVWKARNIPDTWHEKMAAGSAHPHIKPAKLQRELIAAVSDEGDFVLDPAAGSFSVLEAARSLKRNFIGCDLNG